MILILGIIISNGVLHRLNSIKANKHKYDPNNNPNFWMAISEL